MDIVVVGLGPAALYLTSRLAAEGFEVGIFGSFPEVLPEFVSKETVIEFELFDFVLNKIKRIAEFSESFELEERILEGSVIDTFSFMRNLLMRSVKYGAEVFVGATTEIGEKVKLKWLEKSLEIEPKLLVVEESCGKTVFGAEIARVPTNEDTLEFYRGKNMLLLPAKKNAVVYGSLDFSWHKFENVAILSVKKLFIPPERALVERKLLRVGRAAGHVNEFGWMLENGLYYGRLLTECLLKYLEGEERALEIYERKGKARGKGSWRTAINI